MLRICILLAFLVGCGSKAPKTTSNTATGSGGTTGSAAAGSGETDCGGSGTCLALCEGEKGADCNAKCEKEYPGCYK